MNRGRRAFLAGAGALLAAPARAQNPRTIRDSAGREVALPARVTRVYAAGPPAGILLYALAPDLMIGWTSAFRAHERPFVPERYADLPTLGRLTGRGNTANVEVVLEARPDLIFDYGTVNDTYASLAERVQRQTGIPYLLIDGRFDAMAESFRLLGEVVGLPERGRDFAARTAAILADVSARAGRVPQTQRPRVYYARGPRGLDTGLAGSINVESLEFMGATNVAAELGRGGLVQVSLEQILRWNPDTIVTVDPNFHRDVFGDPLWRAVHAVREGRVFLAPNAPFGWIDFPPSVNRLIGLRWLGKVLYPAQFPEPLGPEVAAFFERFYHRRPDEAQLAQLLRTAEPAPAR